MSQTKQQRMRALIAQMNRCYLCPFAFHRTNIVPHAGSITAKAALIGEAPGDAEDDTGEAFVGPAGKDMTNIAMDFAIKREMLYICNLLKCQPKPPFCAKKNATPTAEWVTNCFPYLWEQIQIVEPELIVLTGKPATNFVLNLNQNTPIGQTAGRKGVLEMFGPYAVNWECKYTVMYHPAAVMHARNPDTKAKYVKNIRDTFHYVRGQI